MRVLVAVLLALGLAPAWAEPLADVPYAIGYGDRLITHVMVNGKGPFEFLIDTASSRTVLYEHTREALSVNPASQETVSIYGIAGVSTSFPYQVQELKIGNESINNLTVVAVPDPQKVSYEPDGVLGIDVLQRYFVVLDRKEQRFRLYAPADRPAAYTRWDSTPLTPHQITGVSTAFWFFNAKVQGEDARTLLDLGSGISILNWELAEELHFKKRDFPPPPESIQDVLGRVSPVFILRNMRITIGNYSWLGQTAVVADAKIFSLVDLSYRPAAILGPGLLKNSSIAIDFAGQRLYVEH